MRRLVLVGLMALSLALGFAWGSRSAVPGGESVQAGVVWGSQPQAGVIWGSPPVAKSGVIWGT